MNTKKKVLISIIAVFVIALVAFLTLVFAGVVSYNEVWMKYSVLGSLLVIFVCLNCMFGRYTDTDEALFCLKTLKRFMSGINSAKDVNFVKRKTIHNQINSALVLLSDLVAQNDYYDMKGEIAKLSKIRDCYGLNQGEKIRLNEEEKAGQVEVVERLITELKNKKRK